MANETILIVDDGKENREFIREYVLEPNGYRSMQARDGLEGLEMAVKYRPDLILLDFNMPRLDGAGVIKRLSDRKIDIPIILMTFYGSEDIAIEVFRMGVRDYVKKPFSVEEMTHAIDHALTETRLRREKEALNTRILQSNRQLQLRLQELNVLYSIGKQVTSITNMNALLPRIVDAAVQITRAEEGRLYLLDDGEIVCRAKRRRGKPHAKSINRPTRNPIAAHVLQTSQALVLTPQQLQRTNGGKSGPVAAAYVPLILSGEPIGVLSVANISNNAKLFSQHDSALLSALGDYATIAIANSQHYQTLKEAKEREKSMIRGTFERFVPPSVVEKVLDAPESLQLGGQRREISVVFADIRGYSAWSENAPPEQIVETLNHYLSIAGEVILGWEGTLDKFMGDGLMAIFNAPGDQPDHVHRAADSALALMRAAEEISSLYGYQLTYSIGVNVGEAVVGYIGTDRAMNYTAIGDSVNLAKRLQESGKPGQILVEGEVVRRLGNLVDATPLGEMKVKGRAQPAQAFELTGLRYPMPVTG